LSTVEAEAEAGGNAAERELGDRQHSEARGAARGERSGAGRLGRSLWPSDHFLEEDRAAA
jgi:hypothetical protein